MRAAALDLLFPRRCAGCGAGPWPFCASCLLRLEPLAPPWCVRCGSPSAIDVPRCRDCPPPAVTSARAPFRYEGPAREAVHRLKFSGWRDVGAALAAAIAACEGLPEADMVTWVPLARRRLAERGYDQARALAVALGRELGLPVTRGLRRVVASGPQSKRRARTGAPRCRGRSPPSGLRGSASCWSTTSSPPAPPLPRAPRRSARPGPARCTWRRQPGPCIGR